MQDGYCGNDVVFSCIRKITEKAKVAQWRVYRVKDKKAYKSYLTAIENKDWKLADEVKSEAMEQVQDQRLDELLKYPNAEDTWADLVEAWGVYKLITGNAYIAADRIEAGNNAGKPSTLYNLPAQWVQIIADVNRFPALS